MLRKNRTVKGVEPKGSEISLLKRMTPVRVSGSFNSEDYKTRRGSRRPSKTLTDEIQRPSSCAIVIQEEESMVPLPPKLIDEEDAQNDRDKVVIVVTDKKSERESEGAANLSVKSIRNGAPGNTVPDVFRPLKPPSKDSSRIEDLNDDGSEVFDHDDKYYRSRRYRSDNDVVKSDTIGSIMTSSSLKRYQSLDEAKGFHHKLLLDSKYRFPHFCTFCGNELVVHNDICLTKSGISIRRPSVEGASVSLRSVHPGHFRSRMSTYDGPPPENKTNAVEEVPFTESIIEKHLPSSPSYINVPLSNSDQFLNEVQDKEEGCKISDSMFQRKEITKATISRRKSFEIVTGSIKPVNGSVEREEPNSILALNNKNA